MIDLNARDPIINMVVVVFRTGGMMICRRRKLCVDLAVLMPPEAGICLMAEGFNLNMILTTLMVQQLTEILVATTLSSSRLGLAADSPEQ